MMLLRKMHIMLRYKILKTKRLILLNAKINKVKGRIPCITNLDKIAPLNAKINEVKNKIPNITNLATTTTTVLTAVENKIPYVSSNLVKKTDYNRKIMKLKIKLMLIMIIINILLLKNLIS